MQTTKYPTASLVFNIKFNTFTKIKVMKDKARIQLEKKPETIAFGDWVAKFTVHIVEGKTPTTSNPVIIFLN